LYTLRDEFYASGICDFRVTSYTYACPQSLTRFVVIFTYCDIDLLEGYFCKIRI